MGIFSRKKITQAVDQETCKHLEWHPETKENGWRSRCIQCGVKSAGSCQEIIPWRPDELSTNRVTKFLRWLKNDR